MTSLTIALSTITFFQSVFPRVMISSLGHDYLYSFFQRLSPDSHELDRIDLRPHRARLSGMELLGILQTAHPTSRPHLKQDKSRGMPQSWSYDCGIPLLLSLGGDCDESVIHVWQRERIL